MFKKLISILLVCALIFALTAQMFAVNAEGAGDNLFVVENDLNGDGKCDANDLTTLKKLLLGTIDNVPNGNADTNGDTLIDICDLISFKKFLIGANAIWDLTDVESNTVVATNGNWSQPLYFKETGSTALLKTTVTRLDKTNNTEGTRHTQPLIGITISDGTNSGYIGIRANAIVTNGDDSNWERVIGRDMFVTWTGGENQTAQVDFVLKNNKLQIFIDGKGIIEKALSDIVPKIADDATVSVGLVTDSFGEIAKLQFSNIEFTTDAAEVAKYNSLGCGLVKYAFVNGKVLTSAVSKWDISNIANGKVRAADTIESKQQPLYFAETGKTMHLSTHVSATTDSGDNLGVGIMMTDGVKEMYICTHDNRILFAPYAGGVIYYDGAGSTFTNKPLSPSEGVTEADFDFMFAGDVLTITVNDSQSVILNATALGIPLNKNWAFGIVARNDSTDKFDITFSDIEYTTNATKVSEYNADIGGLFATKAFVNGKVLTSAVSDWDISDIANGNVRAASTLGYSDQPIYFPETGQTMHLSTHVKVTDTTEGRPIAAVYISDGTKGTWVGVRGDLYHSHATNGGLYAPINLGKDWFSPANGGPKEADIDFVLEDGTITVTVKDANITKSASITLADLGLPTNTDMAFGLFARRGTKNNVPVPLDMTFSDISFTNDAAVVAAYLEGKN